MAFIISLRKSPSGNVEILRDGVRVSTAAPSAAEGIARAMGGTFIGEQDPQTFLQQQQQAAPAPTIEPGVAEGRVAADPLLGGLERGSIKNPDGTLKSLAQANRERTERGHAPLTEAEYNSLVLRFGGLSEVQKGIVAETEEDIDIESRLAVSNLSEEEKQFARVFYTLQSANDEKTANALLGALELGKQFADPIFSQKIAIAKDELQRGFVSLEQDLAFQNQSLTNRLADLREDVAARRETLSMEERQQFAQLERSYKQTLDTTREDLARRGFTFSTRAAEREALIEAETGELRESLTRQFGERRRELGAFETRQERDITAETERLRRVAGETAETRLRGAEELFGTQRLPALGAISGAPTIQELLRQRGFSTIGELPGTAEQQRLASVGQFTGFVF